MTRNLRKAFAITILIQGAAVAFAQADDVTVKTKTKTNRVDSRNRVDSQNRIGAKSRVAPQSRIDSQNKYNQQYGERTQSNVTTAPGASANATMGQGTSGGLSTTSGDTQVSTTEVKTVEAKKESKNRGFNVGVIGNYTIANPNEINGGSNATLGSAQNPAGGGVLMQAPLGMYSSVGAEVQYLVRNAGIVGQDDFQMLHVPVIARVYPFRIVSLGLGGYYSRVLSSGDAGRVASPALQFGDNDYGAIGVAGVDIPIGKTFGLIAEGRLTQSVASQIGDANTWNDRNLQGVAGVRLNLSEL